MKFKKRLSSREELTFWIVFGGVVAISDIINGKYLWAGCCMGLGLILIYIRDSL